MPKLIDYVRTSALISFVVLMAIVALACAPSSKSVNGASNEYVSLGALYRFEESLEILVEQAHAKPRQLDRNEVASLFEDSFGVKLPITSERSEELALPNRRILSQALRQVVFYVESDTFIESFYNLVTAELGDGYNSPTTSLASKKSGRGSGVNPIPAQILHEELVKHRLFSDAALVRKAFEADDVLHFGSHFLHLDAQAMSDSQIPPNAVIEFPHDSRPSQPPLSGIELEPGTRIVAIVHPSCGPSNSAMTFFDGLSASAPLLAQNIEWVSPPRALFNYAEITDWNNQSSSVDLSIAYRASDWPEEVSFAVTPVFYIFSGGSLTETLVGWPNELQYSELVRATEEAQ